MSCCLMEGFIRASTSSKDAQDRLWKVGKVLKEMFGSKSEEGGMEAGATLGRAFRKAAQCAVFDGD